MVGVVQDNLGGYSGLRRSFGTEWPTRVMVPVPLGEVAARDLYPDAAPSLEHVSSWAEIYLILVHLVWRNRRWLGQGLAVTCPDDTLLYVRRTPPRGDDAQLGGEVRVGRRSDSVQGKADWPNSRKVLLQGTEI